MLCPAQPDSLRVEIARGLCVGRGIGVGTYPDVGSVFGPGHELLEGRVQQRLKHIRGPAQHLSRGAVEGDFITCLEHPPVRGRDHPLDQIETHRRGTDDAGQAHAPPDHRGVAGDATAFGQHGLGGVHPANILGRGFAAHQNTFLAPCGTGLRVIRVEHDPAGGGTGAGGNAAPDHIAFHPWVNLPVQQLCQGAGLDTHQRLFAGDDPFVRQRHRDPHRRPRGPRHAHAIKDKQLSVRDDEFHLHLGAQPHPHQRRVLFEHLESFGGVFLKRRAARIARQVKRIGGVLQGVAPLRLAQVPPGDLWQAGGAVHQLQHARAANARAHTEHHLLHDQAQPRIRRCPLGLPQQPRRGTLPRPRHGTEHGGQLGHTVLGEAFFGLKLVGPQGLQQRLAPVAFDVVEHIGVQPRHIDGIGLHETGIKRRCGSLAHAFAIVGIAVIVHADVHHRPRPAPIRVLARGAHA